MQDLCLDVHRSHCEYQTVVMTHDLERSSFCKSLRNYSIQFDYDHTTLSVLHINKMSYLNVILILILNHFFCVCIRKNISTERRASSILDENI